MKDPMCATRLKPDQYSRFRLIAKRNSRSVAGELRYLVLRHLRENGKVSK